MRTALHLRAGRARARNARPARRSRAPAKLARRSTGRDTRWTAAATRIVAEITSAMRSLGKTAQRAAAKRGSIVPRQWRKATARTAAPHVRRSRPSKVSHPAPLRRLGLERRRRLLEQLKRPLRLHDKALAARASVRAAISSRGEGFGRPREGIAVAAERVSEALRAHHSVDVRASAVGLYGPAVGAGAQL